jgi:hypothetical protein
MNREQMLSMVKSYLDTQEDPAQIVGFVEELVDKAEKRGHIQGYKRGIFQGDWAKGHVKEAVSTGADGQQVLTYIAQRDYDVWQKEQTQNQN